MDAFGGAGGWVGGEDLGADVGGERGDGGGVKLGVAWEEAFGGRLSV